MSVFSFVLTEKCNWNCEYCRFPHINHQKEPTIDTLSVHLPYIKKIMDKLHKNGLLVFIEAQGGEIGTLPKETIEYFLSNIGYPIHISTNGEFLRKEYHLYENIRPYIEAIEYHITDFENKKIIDYNDNNIFISKGIVHNNIDEIIKFIKDYSYITFDYIEFEFDINESRKMNKDMYHELYDKIKLLRNVTDKAKNIIKQRGLEHPEHRNNCMKYNGTVLINFARETICSCQRDLNNSIELTEENLMKRLLNFPVNIFEMDRCSSCTRLYSTKFDKTVIERSLKIRNIFK